MMKEQYIKLGEGFLIVYSIEKRSSWEKAIQFRELVLRGKDEANWFPMVIFGNKCDIQHRNVTTEEASTYCRSVGVRHLEGSAKTRMNIEEAFFQLVREIKRYETSKSEKKEQSNKNKEKKKGCFLI